MPKPMKIVIPPSGGSGEEDDQNDQENQDPTKDTDDRKDGQGGNGDQGGDKEPFDEARARATIAAQREAEKAAKAEAKKAAKERDELAAKLKEHEDAQLSELERFKKKAEELEAQAQKADQARKDTALRYEVAIHAAKANLHNPEIAHRLIDLGKVEYGEDGSPSNVEALMAELVKANPYLVKGTASNDVPKTPDGNHGRPTDEEIRKQAGNRLYRPRL